MMIARARGQAAEVGAADVEFHLSEIEHLPVADGTVNAILSNRVINLSPDTAQVFLDCYRVLRPGGRLAISDVETMLAAAGFHDIRVRVRPESRAVIRDWLPGGGAEDYVASTTSEATKPSPETD